MAKIKTVLEVGTFETRLLTLESAVSGEIRLKKCLSVNTPRDYVASTYIELPIMDALPIKANITSLVKGAGLSRDNILLMLPDHSAISEMLIAPPKYSTKEMEEAVREDLEPMMPLPYDNWYVVHKSIGTFEDDEITYIMAILKNNLLEIGGIVQNTGLNPVVIDTNFLNTANLIEDYLSSPDNKEKNICMVHLGHESTSIGIFKDGVLKTMQNRPVGGYDFTRQISRHFHVSEEDADKFKRNEIFFLPEFSPEQDAQYNYTVIKNVFTALCREIFSAIEGYLTKFREFTIHEIIISGGGANFENISVLLAANLNTPVRRICDLYQLYSNGNLVGDAEKNSLAAACGCFMRE